LVRGAVSLSSQRAAARFRLPLPRPNPRLRLAYAKGLAPPAVLARHAVRNALLPVIAALGVDLSFLVGGALVIEQVFAIPGTGRQVFQAINGRDYPLVEATVFVVAVWVVLVNFLIDVLYGYIDPRIATDAAH
jgi:peptide/nickel transport system permease protein